MKLKLLKRKSWSDESGVSEIIGNILILMITVVLFSGIMMFVNQMPVPELTTKTDFAASVEFEYETDLTLTATLTITHIGGAVMDSTEALVLVSIDEMTEGYRLSEAEDAFTLEEWSMGAEWVMSYNSASPGYSALSPASSISVTIVDDISHNAVWTSQVSGGMGGTPPTILQRYVDSDVDTISADPVKEYDDFTLFVKVTDLDKDLESVWVDSSAIVGGEIVD
ncbi:MAG TPA: type IV pilin, partial [Thermoplasmata archaeon]|nr:type IV pilin [Thermoplasmata archaeon]